MPENTTIVLMVIGQIFTAGVVYGSIRSDLRAAIRESEFAIASAKEAHERIDDILLSH